MNAALFPDLIVNGETVPHTVVAAEAQNHEAPKGKPGIAWRKAANAVAVRTLLLQEAKRRAMQAEPAEVAPGRFETDEEALIRGLLDTVIDAQAPNDADIHAEWQRDPSRFRSPPLWEVSHILSACDPRDDAAKTAAAARAAALLALVQANPRSFARLAAENSDCGSKSAGGSLGQLTPGDTVPEFEAVLRSLSEGEITAEPVLTRYGYHIIRMDAVAPTDELPFAAVQDKIRDAMEKAAWAKAARAYIATLVGTAQITGADLKPV